ncbi:hypothetical protein KI387_024529, partial [Taxus chinensis]
SQAFETFQKFKALVENEVGRKIKTLHSDRGGEFTSNEVQDLPGSSWDSSTNASYSPHHNRMVVERRNRTIMEMVRCMIDYS